MKESAAPDESARLAYEAFASIYDDFNHLNDYEMWLGALLPELEKHGLRKGGLLDIGCGTGRAFEPMLRRGWEILGCDLTPGMLAEARRKFGDAVPLEVADIRTLPSFGEFELVWALNDVINYLVGDGDLERALAGMRANLAPGGLVLFDANTLSLFEASFASGDDEGMSVGEWRWVGQEDGVEAGATFEAQVSGGEIAPHLHRERHWTEDQVRAAMETAELELLTVLGQREVDTRVMLEQPPDEQLHYKAIYIARAVE
ncbi:MAG TPA: class I SAM-dependent methyltransferase [Solirubrobacterales bacterium]|jgi:SAM-dependent methyltransferase|nr:class I SAM-dependent methyltransferase [Solirubrobacterales bacterium]